MKKPVIEKLYFSPVKSLSFSSSPELEVKKILALQMTEFLPLQDLLIDLWHTIMKKILKKEI